MDPIGIFDSGVGGLSVLHAIESRLPNHPLLYYADTQHFPYGNKSSDQITQICADITTFLMKKNICLLVIACHTASAQCIDHLRERFSIPIIGMIEPTVQSLGLGKIAIMATDGTIRSRVYEQQLLDSHPIFLSCSSLAEKIQNDALDIDETLRDILTPVHQEIIDTLVLGCTHYSLIASRIQEQLPDHTRILDPAEAVGAKVAQSIKSQDLKRDLPIHTLYVSGEQTSLNNFLRRFPAKSPYVIASI